MRFAIASLSFLSAATLLTLTPTSTPSARAACAVTDVGVQVAIHDKLQQPAQQDSKVTMDDQGPCLGNTLTGTTTQLYFGNDGGVTQERESHYKLVGDPKSSVGVDTPIIKTPVDINVDVDNPAARIPR